MGPDKERRRDPRQLMRYLVRFDDEGELRMAFTGNLSSDGLFLQTKFPPPPGAFIRMLIRTAAGTVERTGLVVWARFNLRPRPHPSVASGAGIRFSPESVAVQGEA